MSNTTKRTTKRTTKIIRCETNKKLTREEASLIIQKQYRKKKNREEATTIAKGHNKLQIKCCPKFKHSKWRTKKEAWEKDLSNP